MNCTRPIGTGPFPENLPWYCYLHNWTPFKIDALGLVTFLGADEINASLGRLLPSRYLEYLPLLGAFVITGERFKDKSPSFNLYNLTDGINTTELSFWLSRWMTAQEFEVTRSLVRFEIQRTPHHPPDRHIVAAVLSFTLLGFLVAMTILIGDWYGFANAIAMIILVTTRAYILHAHRAAIDEKVNVVTTNEDGTPKPDPELKKCLVIMDDSKAVTMYIPSSILVPICVRNPEPLHPWRYHMLRYLAWIAFAVHIISIGMATLLPQMYTVALMVIPTVLICWKFGCDDSKWLPTFNYRVRGKPYQPHSYECWFGSLLKAYVTEWPVGAEFVSRRERDEKGSTRETWSRQHKRAVMEPAKRSQKRQELYAWLNMTVDEETSMGKWDLLPHERNNNKSWWATYLAKKKLIQDDPIDIMRISCWDNTARGDVGAESDSSSRDGSYGVPAGYRPPTRVDTDLTSNGLVVVMNNVRSAMLGMGFSAEPDPDELPVSEQSRSTRNPHTKSDHAS